MFVLGPSSSGGNLSLRASSGRRCWVGNPRELRRSSRLWCWVGLQGGDLPRESDEESLGIPRGPRETLRPRSWVDNPRLESASRRSTAAPPRPERVPRRAIAARKTQLRRTQTRKRRCKLERTLLRKMLRMARGYHKVVTGSAASSVPDPSGSTAAGGWAGKWVLSGKGLEKGGALRGAGRLCVEGRGFFEKPRGCRGGKITMFADFP